MNANASLWIEALRKGEYKQTSHRLRQNRKFFWRAPSFCAMGVLYDLYLKSKGEKWPEKPPYGPLPDAVLAWAGISRELECDVIGYNDIGMGFRDLASVIEAHLYRAERDRRWKEAGVIVSRFVERAKTAASADSSAAAGSKSAA
ncbi:MAG TPA: hypothetical protein VFV10_13335 [Gammaproteobacteria bacterium]|nr:hypothetical protein [Gammaproteobacteria bacterium]